MPKKFQKSFHGYLSRLKTHTQHVHITSRSLSNSTSWILSGCKHPKTPSFAVNKNSEKTESQHAATLSDIDRFLVENFSTLYVEDGDDHKKKKKEEEPSNGFHYESPKFIDPVPEIRSSSRFFISPRTSSSLVDEFRSKSSASTSSEAKTSEALGSSAEVKGVPLIDESIAVLTYSSDPYDDFRQSMEEMIEARLTQNESIDWDFMEDLLFCYLKLNDKKSYRYILGAFVDLTAGMRNNNNGGIPAEEGRRLMKGGRRSRMEVECNARKDFGH
ncbi:hypothetical protein ACHQM5_002276 [Ranunculus cassubicifolius]